MQKKKRTKKKRGRKGTLLPKLLITVAALFGTIVGWGHIASTDPLLQSDQPIVVGGVAESQGPTPITTTRSSR